MGGQFAVHNQKKVRFAALSSDSFIQLQLPQMVCLLTRGLQEPPIYIPPHRLCRRAVR